MKHLLTLTLLIALPAWGSIHEDLALLAQKKAAVASFDTFDDATAIYSPVGLGGFAGDVYRLRRVSDNAEGDFTAAELSDGTLATWAGGAVVKIAAIYDQTGNGHTLTTSDAADQMTIMTSGVLTEQSGNPVMDFSSGSSSADHLVTSLPAQYIYLVAEYSGSGNVGVASDSSNNDIFISSTTISLDGGGSDEGQYAYDDGAWSSTDANHTVTQPTTQTLFCFRVTSGSWSEFTEILSSRGGVDAWSDYVWAMVFYDSDRSATDDTIRTDLNDIFSIY
jgi:hypothetical protein